MPLIRLLLLLCIVALALPAPVMAGWRVIPIRLDLSARQKTGVIKIINDEDQPLNLQMKVSEWTQDAKGKDRYQESEDLIFFPKILTIPPQEERIIRAGIKVPEAKRESAYRLFIEQIPTKNDGDGATVAIAIRFGVPIFSLPLEHKAAGSLENLDLKDGVLSATVANTGNVHLQIRKLTVRGFDAEQKETFSQSVQGWYLLPGVSREHQIELPAEECRRSETLEITLKSNQLDLQRQLPVESAKCLPASTP